MRNQPKKALCFSLALSRCTGCMACVVACMDEKDVSSEGPAFRQVVPLERGTYPEARLTFLSMACQHCGDALCLRVCPSGAITKREGDGIVVTDPDRCVGCHSCALACPFGAPRFLESGKMQKCDFCVGRIEQGLEPACVRTCPTRALHYGAVEDLTAERARRSADTLLDALVIQPDSVLP